MVYEDLKTIQLKRGTKAVLEARLTADDLGIPKKSEPIYEIDTAKLKFGDGERSYADLPYFGSENATEAELNKALSTKVDNSTYIEAISNINTEIGTKADSSAVTDVSRRVAAIEQDYLKTADKYDDTALANRVSVVENTLNHETAGLVQRVEAIEKFWAETEDGNQIVDTLQDIQAYIEADKSAAEQMNASITALTEEVSVVKIIAEAARTEDEVNDQIDAKIITANLGQFAIASIVEEKLNLKANTADVVSNNTFELFKTGNEKAITTARDNAISAAKAWVSEQKYASEADVSSQISTLNTSITTVKGVAEAAATKVYVDGELNKKANIVDVYTKDEVYTKTEIDTANNEVQARISTLTTAVETASSTATSAAADAADALKATTRVSNLAEENKEKLLNVQDQVSAIQSTLETKAEIEDVYSKAEADATFMTEAEVDARIDALILAADPEGGTTIQNIKNLVEYVDENAGEITTLIEAVNTNTDKLAGIETTVTEYVTEQTKQVNINKLVQDEQDVLILDCGLAPKPANPEIT